MSNAKDEFFCFPFLKYFQSILFSDNSESNEYIIVLFYFPATALLCGLMILYYYRQCIVLPVSFCSFVCFVALHHKSTAMVMLGWSVHLTTLFSWASLN